jgi:RepB DNA-primase from phage plasmid
MSFNANGADTISAVDLLKTFFDHTNEQVYICTFPNERDDPKQVGERRVHTRLPRQVTSFVKNWDKPGRGLFFCVGTVKAGARRNKENIVETIGLHADLDLKDIDLGYTREQIVCKLKGLQYPPTAIVFSGNGLHSYWLFKEPMETQPNVDRIEMALRQLADLVAGDLAVCEVSRVMRLPGTHNTKSGAWTEVTVLSLDGRRRYELDDLEEWLAEVSPILLRKSRERALTAGETNPFLECARQWGIKERIDVDQRLADMMYMAGGLNSIHTTQRSCTAAMLNRGMHIEEVIERVFVATRAAAGEYGARWNWQREERKIRGMCLSWLRKRPHLKAEQDGQRPEVVS